MTTEEKNEMYRKNMQKHIKGRKSKIIALAVLPVAGIAVTLLLGSVGNARQNEIANATVLDTMSVGEFLEKNGTGSAIYTGEIKAADPVYCADEGGEYISFLREVKQEEKIYDKDADKYETNTTTISSDSDTCDEIEIDDVVVPTGRFHELPLYSKTRSEGAASNQFKTSFSYTPTHLAGTFFLKCENGEVTSARYYESADVAGESKRGFGTARAIIWIFIVGIEIFLLVDIIKTSNAIKNIEGKIQ